MGASAHGTVDAGAFLSSMGENIDIGGFNEAFGEVIKVRDDDGLYEFSVEKAKNKSAHFRFDVAILAQVFGEKLVSFSQMLNTLADIDFAPNYTPTKSEFDLSEHFLLQSLILRSQLQCLAVLDDGLTILARFIMAFSTE